MGSIETKYYSDMFPSRAFVGFDSLLKEAETFLHNSKSYEKYPPISVYKENDTKYSIELAVAGFNPEDLEVVTKERTLTIKGNVPQKDNPKDYIFKGISTKSFEQSFKLYKDVVVKDVEYKNGILKIDLERIIPEEEKEKKLEITYVK